MNGIRNFLIIQKKISLLESKMTKQAEKLHFIREQVAHKLEGQIKQELEIHLIH